MTPAWILDSVAVLVLAAAALSGVRLVLAGPPHAGAVPSDADTDAAYCVMGLAMAGLLAAGMRVLPSGEWEGVFALLAVWFACRSVREARAMPQLAHSVAMLYIYYALAVTASGGPEMAGMAAGSSGTEIQTLKYPTLAFIFGLILIGYSIWDLDQVSGGHHDLSNAGLSLRARLLSPVVTVCCRIVMGVTMAFALFIRI